MQTVGDNIVKIREAAGLSQAQLADRLRVRQPSVWKLENSKGLPHCATLFKVAIALGCSIELLVAGVNAVYDAVVDKVTLEELAHKVARKHKPPAQIRQLKKKTAR